MDKCICWASKLPAVYKDKQPLGLCTSSHCEHELVGDGAFFPA